MAFIPNSFPMVGSAILTEDTPKGCKNAPNVVTIKTIFFSTALSVLMASILIQLKEGVSPNENPDYEIRFHVKNSFTKKLDIDIKKL
jgi:hypothetical protein